MTSSAATLQSYRQLVAAEPVLNRIGPLRDLVPDLPADTLFHAGPPFASKDAVPAPVRNSIAATASMEDLNPDTIDLMPAQDIGLVTPLAFVAGPNTWCLEVVDANNPDLKRFSPLNDGPLPDALRFGTGRPAGIALAERLNASVGPDLARHLKKGAPLLPLLAAGLAGGDDLHGHLAAAQAFMPSLFDAGISDETRGFITDANQFVLNIVMATAATMIGAGAGVADSELIVAAGGNGVDVGYKLAGAPGTWLTLPANRPVGPKFPGKEDMAALPAIGDSAVIDAVGFGAACLRFCPTLKDALEGHIDPAHFTDAAHQAFVGPHPALPDQSIHVGLDLTQPRACLGIMLGMVGAMGTEGIVGRGVAPWPAP